LEETLQTLQDQIDEDKKSLDEAQEALAAAMQKEATAGETARITAAKHETLDKDLKYWMNHCSKEYIRLEGEVCALKKIRGELYKIKGGGHSAFFQDCEVSKWEPGPCFRFVPGGEIVEATCGGGWQYLHRGVLTKAEGGAKCLESFVAFVLLRCAPEGSQLISLSNTTIKAKLVCINIVT